MNQWTLKEEIIDAAPLEHTHTSHLWTHTIRVCVCLRECVFQLMTKAIRIVYILYHTYGGWASILTMLRSLFACSRQQKPSQIETDQKFSMKTHTNGENHEKRLTMLLQFKYQFHGFTPFDLVVVGAAFIWGRFDWIKVHSVLVDADAETLTLPNNTHINTTPAPIQLKFNPYCSNRNNCQPKKTRVVRYEDGKYTILPNAQQQTVESRSGEAKLFALWECHSH